jgi:hypothetical protein
MSLRLLLTNEAWVETASILATLKSHAGSFLCSATGAASELFSVLPARGDPGATCLSLLGAETQVQGGGTGQ